MTEPEKYVPRRKNAFKMRPKNVVITPPNPFEAAKGGPKEDSEIPSKKVEIKPPAPFKAAGGPKKDLKIPSKNLGIKPRDPLDVAKDVIAKRSKEAPANVSGAGDGPANDTNLVQEPPVSVSEGGGTAKYLVGGLASAAGFGVLVAAVLGYKARQKRQLSKKVKTRISREASAAGQLGQGNANVQFKSLRSVRSRSEKSAAMPQSAASDLVGKSSAWNATYSAMGETAMPSSMPTTGSLNLAVSATSSVTPAVETCTNIG
eukprot:GHVT01062410.1.p2 GENE.GHVT01062410.1~~GHVT01062410.1.p2  ORF type:complete len:260 (+),score=27.80 GHVT01062410.1:3988-4767(+)